MRNKLLLVSVCLLALVACAPLPSVPVEERSVLTERQQIDEFGGQLIRIAQPGDTLHSIAFIAGLDVNKVAAWNDIKDTSKLQIGQRIRLTQPIGFVAVKPKPQAKASPKANTKLGAKTGETRERNDERVLSTPSSVKVADNKPGSTKLGWLWPSPGKVIRQFALAKGQQGIDIQSTKGRAVRASSAGNVVYVGSSLKGYGNLIIVKHNETFLSAYAHNDKILVKEGQRVARQQVIGAVGINNRREPALHFQIRKNGRPVNPLSYLPNRP